MNDFIYNIPTKVYFGREQIDNLAMEVKNYGTKVLLVYGGGSIKKIGLYDRLIEVLGKEKIEVFELSGIDPNPRIESVREGARICKENNIELVLAVGGGSTIDASKFIAAGACVDFDVWDFFAEWKPIEKALPLITVLTMSATGSEMDSGAVISNMETNEKIGRGSVHMLPKVSFLNPEATYSVSAYQTACGAADILSHIMEEYFNMDDGLYMLDCFMEGLMKTVIKYAPIAMEKPDDYEARANLMWASSWAINGFINGGRRQPWSCHPIEHELSAFYDITHGLGLAIITPKWMKYCLNDKTVDKFYQFGTNVFSIDSAMDKKKVAQKAIEKTEEFLYQILDLKSNLTDININDEKFGAMSEKACRGGKIDGFVKLEPKDVENILRMSL